MADSRQMAAAEQACEQLSSTLLLDPNVCLIDIGSEHGQLVVRVHLRTEAARETTPVPGQVNGIPVRVVIADYEIRPAE